MHNVNMNTRDDFNRQFEAIENVCMWCPRHPADEGGEDECERCMVRREYDLLREDWDKWERRGWDYRGEDWIVCVAYRTGTEWDNLSEWYFDRYRDAIGWLDTMSNDPTALVKAYKNVLAGCKEMQISLWNDAVSPDAYEVRNVTIIEE